MVLTVWSCAVCVCGLTQQVRIGRGTTWQGCGTYFLLLGPDVISLTSIWLTTGPRPYIPELPRPPQCCNLLVDESRSVAWPTHSACVELTLGWGWHRKFPIMSDVNSSPRPPDFVPTALATRLQRPVLAAIVTTFNVLPITLFWEYPYTS